MSDKKLLYYVIKESEEEGARYCHGRSWYYDRELAGKYPTIREAAFCPPAGSVIVAVEQSKAGLEVRRVLNDREACPEGAELKWAVVDRKSGRITSGLFDDILTEICFSPVSSRWVRIAITNQAYIITERVVR